VRTDRRLGRLDSGWEVDRSRVTHGAGEPHPADDADAQDDERAEEPGERPRGAGLAAAW